jgi:hypothetical protein
VKHVSRALIVMGCGALCLIAEDFWKKPFNDWSEKDAAKLLQNSPWSHEVSVSFAGGGGGGGRRERGGGRTGEAEGTTGGTGRNAGSGGSAAGAGMEIAASIMLEVRWQSARPVREAMVVVRFGREKLDSADAKAFLSQVSPGYIVGICGIPPEFARGIARATPEQLQQSAKTTTSLVMKDKELIQASGAQLVPSQKPNMSDLYFFFPKTTEITLEDKEVEFVSRLGPIEIRRKFKLKDMVLGDKLEL